MTFIHTLGKDMVGKDTCVSVYSLRYECYVHKQGTQNSTENLNIYIPCGGKFNFQTEDGSGGTDMKLNVQFSSTRDCTKHDCLENPWVCPMIAQPVASTVKPNVTETDIQGNRFSISGLVLGVIFVFMVCVILVFFILCRRRRQKGHGKSLISLLTSKLRAKGEAQGQVLQEMEEGIDALSVNDGRRNNDIDTEQPSDGEDDDVAPQEESDPPGRPSEDGYGPVPQEDSDSPGRASQDEYGPVPQEESDPPGRPSGDKCFVPQEETGGSSIPHEVNFKGGPEPKPPKEEVGNDVKADYQCP